VLTNRAEDIQMANLSNSKLYKLTAVIKSFRKCMYIEYGKYSTYFTHLLLYIKLHILLSETTQTDSTCHCYRPDEQLSA